VGVRVEPALPACMAGAMGGVAAFVECLVVGMAQRNASTASFQGRTLFSPFGFGDVHDRPRQATACEVGSTSLPLPSTCMHGRVRLLGRSNPPPVPHKPILSTPPRHTSAKLPKLFSLIIPPPPAPLVCAPRHTHTPTSSPIRQTLLPPRSCLLPQQVSLPNLLFPVAVSVSVVGFEPIVAPQTDLSQRHPHTCRRASDIWPVHHHSCPPSPFHTHLRIHIDDFFAIGLPAFTCCVRLDPSPLLL
jgi:hypothetical protein